MDQKHRDILLRLQVRIAMAKVRCLENPLPFLEEVNEYALKHTMFIDHLKEIIYPLPEVIEEDSEIINYDLAGECFEQLSKIKKLVELFDKELNNGKTDIPTP